MPHKITLPLLSILLLAAAAGGRAQALAPYQDPSQSVDARVQDLLKRMTLEEKVAQLQGYRTKDPHAFDDKGNFIGGTHAAALNNGAGSVWAINPGAANGD